mmetsp:Transcript_23990/g.46791  ORF Transcript_23990/g.46791 Transcript_23990/m.46791 type:complete len:101 (-) Transcript_23990:664-966(-)
MSILRLDLPQVEPRFQLHDQKYMSIQLRPFGRKLSQHCARPYPVAVAAPARHIDISVVSVSNIPKAGANQFIAIEGSHATNIAVAPPIARLRPASEHRFS